MKTTADALRFVRGSHEALTWDNLLQGGILASLSCDSSLTLYHLTLHHLGSPSLALMASLLSLAPSSPVTLRFASYAEPFFTYLSYKGNCQRLTKCSLGLTDREGMLCCARSQWLAASILFALAGAFRSNGILLSGFILWGLMIQPILDGKRVRLSSLSSETTYTNILYSCR